MLLRISYLWSSCFLGPLILLSVLLFSGHSSAKKPPQPLETKCNETLLLNDTGEGGFLLRYVETYNPNVSACNRFAWSTVGYPTLFISQESGQCQCEFYLNETDYLSNQTHGSLNISGIHSYFSLAIVFTRLISFEVNAKKASSISAFNVTEACEDRLEYTELNSEYVEWTLSGEEMVANITTETNSSVVLMTINTYFPEKTVGFKRLGKFPKPQISENATMVDITVRNFTEADNDQTDTDGRLALEMFIIHGSNVENGTVTEKEYLDDEYTPSIFSSWTYNVSGKDISSNFNDMGGYLHWKPISYQDSARKSTTSQQIKVKSAGNASECELRTLPKGLATALFGDVVNPVSVSNVTRWFAVFGTDGDDTYLDPTYSTWTLVVGYGKEPSDSISLTVIITIVVGLGVPGVLVVVGGIYVFIKKKPWQAAARLLAKAQGREGYTRLG